MKTEEKLAAARALTEKADAEGRDFTDEERAEVKRYIDEVNAEKATAASDEAKAAAAAARREESERLKHDLEQLGSTPAKGGNIGDRVVDAFGTWVKSFPGGNIPESAKGIQGPVVPIGGLKALISGASETSAGALITNDFYGMVPGGYARPLTLRDVITVGTTSSDTVEYARIGTTTNAAAPVAEATGTSGDFGVKPESTLPFEKVTAPVKTIAHWLPATKRALADAGQLRTLVDGFLRYGIVEELEDQIVQGNGSGENFTGILSVSGVQDQAWSTDLFTTIRKAITLVRTVGRAQPTALLLNPADDERIDLAQDGDDRFYGNGPFNTGPSTVWGIPRVVTEAVPSGTGIVGDLRTVVLWDREQTTVTASDSHSDFFTRNLVAILAEGRFAFGCLRPAALVEIDLTS